MHFELDAAGSADDCRRRIQETFGGQLGKFVPASTFERRVVGRCVNDVITATIVGPTKLVLWSRELELNHTNRPILKGRVVSAGSGCKFVGEINPRLFERCVTFAYFGPLLLFFLPVSIFLGVTQPDPTVLIFLAAIVSMIALGAAGAAVLDRLGSVDRSELVSIISVAMDG